MEILVTVGALCGALSLGATVAEWHLRNAQRTQHSKAQAEMEAIRLKWATELKAISDVHNGLAAKVAEHDDRLCALQLIDRGGFK